MSSFSCVAVNNSCFNDSSVLHNCSICDGRLELSGCLDDHLDVLVDRVCVELLPSSVGIGCCCDLIQASVSLCSNAFK